MNILEKIRKQRQNEITKIGYDCGISLPKRRTLPIVPFDKTPFLICEIKRKSPSKGRLIKSLNPVKQAQLYIKQGVGSISVLTNKRFFSGSLNDILRIKNRFPKVSVLRKDFLLEPEDVDVSFKAGADAILLIAGILSKEKFSQLFYKANKLKMQVLVEVHSKQDIDKIRDCAPPLVGINSRNLTNFTIDKTLPLRLKNAVNWQTKLVFESGISTCEDVELALSAGFDGILIGEAVVKKPALIKKFVPLFYKKSVPNFWGKLYLQKPPFIKICGITNVYDAEISKKLGANILGFVFAPSVRKADPKLLFKLKELDILKVGVVVCDNKKNRILDNQIRELLDLHLLSAIQFHGSETPLSCYKNAFPYYKTIQLGKMEQIKYIQRYICPRVLVDAFSKHLKGGTGKTIPTAILKEVKKNTPLWVAGGLGVDNILDVLQNFSPELVDASSKLESSPGKKDIKKLKQYFEQIKKSENL